MTEPAERVLVLLVTSESPDPYINSIAHCVERERVDTVEFLHVADLGPDGLALGKGASGYSEQVQFRVRHLLETLRNGRYEFSNGPRKGEIVDLPLDAEGLGRAKQRYESYLRLRWRARDISYFDLSKEIVQRWYRYEGTIFDVTAVKKRYLGDLVAICLVEGISALHSFEIRGRPTFDEPWRMLVHDLGRDGYEFVNLLDTPVFRERARRVLGKGLLIRIAAGSTAALLALAMATYFATGGGGAWVQILFLASAVSSIGSFLLTLLARRG